MCTADAAWSVTSDSARDQRDGRKGSALTVLHANLHIGGIVPDRALLFLHLLGVTTVF